MYSYATLSLLYLGSLLVSLYQQGDWSPLGHMDLSEPKPVWNTLSICPTGLTNNQSTGEKLLSVVGKGIGLSFAAQIAEGASEIALNEPHTVNVRGDEVSVFQFIPPQGISDRQLDITATSQSNVAAYLKVSQICEEVDAQKDLESIDYKKESLRLSFSTKGRITLSRVSIPPLTDSVSRWFIGIGLKNLSGDFKLNGSKTVTLKLTRSFDYNYATPVCVLFFVSLVVGVLVSIVAYLLFEESLTQVKPCVDNQVSNKANLVWEMWEVIRYHWNSSGPKTYSDLTVIVGAVLMVGASQLVFTKWYTMNQEGDKDNCYYNDFCYRVVNHDIPFNLMISNLTYIVHGLILSVWVLMLETKVNLRCKSGRDAEEARATENNYCFSIAYAIPCALVYQGLFSALYHLCPSVFTFQFDSAFMLIIAGLTVVLLYNGFEKNSFQNDKDLVNACTFFRFFIMPLFIFNYCATLLNSNYELNKIMQGFFYACLVIWWLLMVFWAFCKLNMHQKVRDDGGEGIFNVFLFILGGLIVPFAIFMFYLFSDPAQAFLLACIACSVVAILAKARLWKKLSKCKFRKLHGKCILQGLFIILTFIILSAALFVFHEAPTTNKTLSPENSRGKNEECVILGFFDWHDLWHFLSSFALLMGAFVVMFISSEPEQGPQAEIRESTGPEEQRKKRAVQAKTRVNNEVEAQGQKRAVQTKIRGNTRKEIRESTGPEEQRKKRAVQAKTRVNNEVEAQGQKRAVQTKIRGKNKPEAQGKKGAVQAKTRGNNETGAQRKKGAVQA